MAENIVYNPQVIAKVFQIWVVGYGMMPEPFRKNIIQSILISKQIAGLVPEMAKVMSYMSV